MLRRTEFARQLGRGLQPGHAPGRRDRRAPGVEAVADQRTAHEGGDGHGPAEEERGGELQPRVAAGDRLARRGVQEPAAPRSQVAVVGREQPAAVARQRREAGEPRAPLDQERPERLGSSATASDGQRWVAGAWRPNQPKAPGRQEPPSLPPSTETSGSRYAALASSTTASRAREITAAERA